MNSNELPYLHEYLYTHFCLWFEARSLQFLSSRTNYKIPGCVPLSAIAEKPRNNAPGQRPGTGQDLPFIFRWYDNQKPCHRTRQRSPAAPNS